MITSIVVINIANIWTKRRIFAIIKSEFPFIYYKAVYKFCNAINTDY